MKRSKIATLLLTGALSVSMLAAGAVMSFADDTAGGDTGNTSNITDLATLNNKKVTLKKNLHYPDGVTFGKMSFKFKFDGSGSAGAPTISDLTIEIPAVTVAGSDGDNVASKTEEIDLASIFRETPTGTYTYTVTEITTDNLTGGYGLEVNTEKAAYTMNVFKQANGEINCTIADKMGKKIDSFDSFVYDNRYTERGGNEDTENGGASLVVTKQLDGDYANANQNFTFTFDFTNGPLDTTNATSYAAKKGDEEITLSNGGTFTLRGGESISFDNIPAGTKVSVTETAVDGYDTTYTNVSNGDSVGSNSNLLIGEKTNSITVINASKDQTITGLALQAAPYVALIGLALAMMAAYVVLRRRAENN